MHGYSNDWVRTVVMVNIKTGQVEHHAGDLMNPTLKNTSDGFDVLTKCLIPEKIREELITNGEGTDGPYLVSLDHNDISLTYKYNPTYGKDKLCTCGHPYYRHFDTYEDMSTAGCKYCHCYFFTPAADKL